MDVGASGRSNNGEEFSSHCSEKPSRNRTSGTRRSLLNADHGGIMDDRRAQFQKQKRENWCARSRQHPDVRCWNPEACQSCHWIWTGWVLPHESGRHCPGSTTRLAVHHCASDHHSAPGTTGPLPRQVGPPAPSIMANKQSPLPGSLSLPRPPSIPILPGPPVGSIRFHRALFFECSGAGWQPCRPSQPTGTADRFR